MGDFQGFRKPEQNWFKLPNEWTDITAEITTLAELKVVEYVLRHTWGWQEYDQLRRITIDEFEHGRKYKDGSRMDKGTGLSKPSIINGLKSAVDRGLLIVEENGNDKARMKKYYGLKMLTPDVKNVDRGCQDVLHRTEKDNLVKKGDVPAAIAATDDPPDDEKSLARNGSTKNNPGHKGNGRLLEEEITIPTSPSKFDFKCGQVLYAAILKRIGGKPHPNSSPQLWAKDFRLMRVKDEWSTKDIKKWLKWYCANMDGDHVPDCQSGESFRHKIGKVIAAHGRIEKDSKSQRLLADMSQDDRDDICQRVWSKAHGLSGRIKHRFNQAEIDDAADKLGIGIGVVSESDLGPWSR